ncbi:hypothetical protein BS17DRAFT_809462 [Gyrodon lividus]|nr:hypothetical protein BS17DRAFT_809462 [Gyrodon lividus]
MSHASPVLISHSYYPDVAAALGGLSGHAPTYVHSSLQGQRLCVVPSRSSIYHVKIPVVLVLADIPEADNSKDYARQGECGAFPNPFPGIAGVLMNASTNQGSSLSLNVVWPTLMNFVRLRSELKHDEAYTSELEGANEAFAPPNDFPAASTFFIAIETMSRSNIKVLLRAWNANAGNKRLLP